MIDNADYPAIVAQIAGRPRRLVTAKQWRAAIFNRQIERDTVIEFERGPGQSDRIRAGDCAPLHALLDEILGVEPEPEAEIVPEPEPEPLPLPESAAEPEAPDGLVTPDGDEPEPEPRRWSDAETAVAYLPPGEVTPSTELKGSKGGPIAALVGLAFIALIIGAVVLQSNGSGRSTESRMPDLVTSNSMLTVEPSATPTTLAAADSYYARSPITIRSSPDANALPKGALSRNALVEGVRSTANADWLEITRGPNSGGFVKMSDVSSDIRPDLDDSVADDYFTTRPATIYSNPDESSATVTTVSAGVKQTVAGSVGQFAEVVVPNGGVGYIPWNVFGGVGGKGEKHALFVDNRCSDQKNFTLSVTVNGQRKVIDDFWSFDPGQATEPTWQSSIIYVDGTELYYADLGPDFHLRDISDRNVQGAGIDKIRVNGQVREMKRIVPILGSNNEYRITFCS